MNLVPCSFALSFSVEHIKSEISFHIILYDTLFIWDNNLLLHIYYLVSGFYHVSYTVAVSLDAV